MASSRLLLAGALFASLAVCAVPSPQNLGADLTLLIENDLEGANSSTANSGVILLSGPPKTLEEAELNCDALGEQLWAPGLKTTADIQRSLNYLVYQGLANETSRFWIGRDGDDSPRAINAMGRVSTASEGLQFSALCTQTAPFSNLTFSDTSEKWRVTVTSNNEDLVGFRDRLSFRFLGIRYAPQPRRFTYSVPYAPSNRSSPTTALEYRSQCLQGNNVGAEDCHFLNIWTPYLPQPTSSRVPRTNTTRSGLKPVMFWIHGGAFMNGAGSDPIFDGGNLASRGDVVLVTFNYRVGTLGFLALKDGITNGNFGFADQVNALDWVVAHIADFGGDPDRITIFGQSAGAASVRAMMASPQALGKFAAAIPLSNLGGLNYGTTYSKYLTIDQEYDTAVALILNQTDCASARSQVDCLRAVPAARFGSIAPARYLIVDGSYLVTDQLELSASAGPPLPLHLMMGITAEDGAPFIAFPPAGVNASAYLSSIGFPAPSAALFPAPADASANETRALFNVSSRLATDGEFRCIDQATASAGLRSGRLSSGVYYYEFDRTYQTVDWPRLDVCEPPRTPSRPRGDPSRPYLRCHSGELYYVFGNLARQGLPARDGHDFPFMRRVVDAFTAFARAYDPNPDQALLVARGYRETLRELQTAGRWEPATAGNLTLRALEWPSSQVPFRELPQCESLGLGLDYYERQGS